MHASLVRGKLQGECLKVQWSVPIATVVNTVECTEYVCATTMLCEHFIERYCICT